jgi:hypothetical protein
MFDVNPRERFVDWKSLPASAVETVEYRQVCSIHFHCAFVRHRCRDRRWEIVVQHRGLELLEGGHQEAGTMEDELVS